MSIFEKLGSLSGEKNQDEIEPVVNAIQAVLASQGGLEGVVEKLNQGGLSSVVSSWVGTGANEPVSSTQIRDALGDDHVDQIASSAATPKQQLLSLLAQELPSLINAITPSGSVPEGGLTNAAITLIRSRFRQYNP